MESIILLTTAIGKTEDVFNKVRDMPEIQKAVMITGRYDIMAIARGESMNEIRNILMTEIRNIDGVKETVTNVVLS